MKQLEKIAITNIRVFYEISKEACRKSEELLNTNRRPKPNGEPGYILTPDPAKNSFKQSLIAIIFAGAYLDALLYLEICKRLGESEYEKLNKKDKTYEGKLRALNFVEPTLLKECKNFRDSRNELAHEKAFKGTSSKGAQSEALRAIALIDRITVALRGAVQETNL